MHEGNSTVTEWCWDWLFPQNMYAKQKPLIVKFYKPHTCRICRSLLLTIASEHFTNPNPKLSKKRNILSLSTVFIFSKLNMCKYLYEHNTIQQLSHKLNKFHRHVTTRNGIMCPWTKGGIKIKSNSQYLVWPRAALSTVVHLLLMDSSCTRFASSFCEMLPHSSAKAPASSFYIFGGEWP
jgi:hypothetical protein